MSMTCHQLIEIIEPYLDDDIPPTRREAIKTHLADCPACRMEVARAQAAREHLTVSSPSALPAGFLERLHARLDAETPQRWFSWRWPVMAAGALACVLLLAFFGAFLRNAHRNGPTPTARVTTPTAPLPEPATPAPQQRQPRVMPDNLGTGQTPQPVVTAHRTTGPRRIHRPAGAGPRIAPEHAVSAIDARYAREIEDIRASLVAPRTDRLAFTAREIQTAARLNREFVNLQRDNALMSDERPGRETVGPFDAVNRNAPPFVGPNALDPASMPSFPFGSVSITNSGDWRHATALSHDTQQDAFEQLRNQIYAPPRDLRFLGKESPDLSSNH
jgi:anti-sigma factor RsiW